MFADEAVAVSPFYTYDRIFLNVTLWRFLKQKEENENKKERNGEISFCSLRVGLLLIVYCYLQELTLSVINDKVNHYNYMFV